MEDLGKAWLITENDIINEKNKFIGLISPRKCGEYVKEFIEQYYLTQYASFNEKVRYKKNRKDWVYPAKYDGMYRGNIFCGRDPFVYAFYCHKLTLSNDILSYSYKKITLGKNESAKNVTEISRSIKIT